MSLRRILGSISHSIANQFTDSFNRADNASSLGIATDGTNWQTLRGTFGISSNKAVSNTSASSIPAAMAPFTGTDVTVELGLPDSSGTGQGALLWVTDANNWWAVDVWQTSSSTCNAWAPYYVFAGNYYTAFYCVVPFYASYCNAWSRGSCNGYNHPYYKNPTYCVAYNFNCSGGYFAYTGCSYGYTTTYPNYTYGGDYCTSSTTVYPKYIRVMQMVAGTLNQITSSFLGNSVNVWGLKAITSGNQITVRAYSDAALTSQVGSDLIHTATGASVTTNYGIKVSSSDVNQGNSIDFLNITRNK